ncbi:outer membrane beta-barrel protein [Maribacter litopenaei]|uniref:Outer membrane beta-barrel protein n=1 Tax=Maribacter litopenaei TaxID=2976127 RepID=A0ABY5Y7T6_9FLAO|nr:outer membrane beta-barrel protein [Maribacter litopenaei]UWX55078.1 outer membrane beta-barrel protein [Maribacter litopenaei]
MKQFMITSAFVFISLITYAQDQKWSVEANYPLRSATDGVVDLGIKYRFLDSDPFNMGLGVNTSFFRNSNNFDYGGTAGNNLEFDYRSNTFLVQPKIFVELETPGLSKLRPFVALGYSINIQDEYQNQGGTITLDEIRKDGGFNFNLGLSYDLSRKFFVQVQYDFLILQKRGTSTFNGQSSTYNFNENLSLLKAGVGFRF